MNQLSANSPYVEIISIADGWECLFEKEKKTTVENKKAEVEGERRHPLQFNMLHSVSCPLF